MPEGLVGEGGVQRTADAGVVGATSSCVLSASDVSIYTSNLTDDITRRTVVEDQSFSSGAVLPYP